jgi:hypothetical protein
VVGILHATFAHAPVTYGVPAWILTQGLDELKKTWEPQQAKPTLNEVVEAGRPTAPKRLEWITIVSTQRQNQRCKQRCGKPNPKQFTSENGISPAAAEAIVRRFAGMVQKGRRP